MNVTRVEDFLHGTTNSLDTVYAGTSAVGIAMNDAGSRAYAQSAGEKNPTKKEERLPPKCSVARSAKGRRVRVVQGRDFGLEALMPMLLRWADRLDRNLRVVLTDVTAPHDFYGKNIVANTVKDDTLCLFLTGRSGKDGDCPVDPGHVDKSWRVGMDQLTMRSFPSKLFAPEFPAYANITDDKKNLVGRVEGKFIYTMLYVPVEMQHLPDEFLPDGKLKLTQVHRLVNEPEKTAPFIEYVFSCYERIVKRYGEELRGELTRVSFNDFCGDALRRRQDKLKTKIEGAKQAAARLEKDLIATVKDMRDRQKEMSLLSTGEIEKDLVSQFQMLGKLVDEGLYQRFRIRNGRLMGLTTRVVINHDGKDYDLGHFMVSVSRSGTMEVEPREKRYPAHPHISEGRQFPCLGTISNDVPRLIGMEKYAMLFQIMREFLESYNPGSKFNRIDLCDVNAEPETPVVDSGINAAEAATVITPGGRAFDQMRGEVERQIDAHAGVPMAMLGGQAGSETNPAPDGNAPQWSDGQVPEEQGGASENRDR